MTNDAALSFSVCTVFLRPYKSPWIRLIRLVSLKDSRFLVQNLLSVPFVLFSSAISLFMRITEKTSYNPPLYYEGKTVKFFSLRSLIRFLFFCIHVDHRRSLPTQTRRGNKNKKKETKHNLWKAKKEKVH